MNARSHITTLCLVLASVAAGFAQQPRNVPQPDGEPLMLDNWTNIIIYVFVPIVVGILYYIWRRNMRKKQQKEDRN